MKINFEVDVTDLDALVKITESEKNYKQSVKHISEICTAEDSASRIQKFAPTMSDYSRILSRPEQREF